jgi:hypothetical protein
MEARSALTTLAAKTITTKPKRCSMLTRQNSDITNEKNAELEP